MVRFSGINLNGRMKCRYIEAETKKMVKIGRKVLIC